MCDYTCFGVKTAIMCPDGRAWLQGYEPCPLGCSGRRTICGKLFICAKCHRAFRTCKELRKHKASEIGIQPRRKQCCIEIKNVKGRKC